MTPMVFAKGLADAGYWGDKLFGRVVSEDMEVGAGFLRKACRARAIYGLEPIFESGHTCIIKVHNFIIFGTKNENSLVEKNYDITIQVGIFVGHHPPFSLPPSPPVSWSPDGLQLCAHFCSFFPLLECSGVVWVGGWTCPCSSWLQLTIWSCSGLSHHPLTIRTRKQLALVSGRHWCKMGQVIDSSVCTSRNVKSKTPAVSTARSLLLRHEPSLILEQCLSK